VKRLFSLDAEPGQDTALALPPPLRAQGLRLVRGGRAVVDAVSLSLAAGEWDAVVGPNGAGKSSLLAALAGLLPPQAGTVWLHGQPLPDWPARERATQLAWLAQQGESTGDLAAQDVVALGRLPQQGLFGLPTEEDRQAVQAAMHETECAAFAHRRLGELSGGERQRVLLARALAVGAPVMLLDEPTTHLDAPHQRALAQSLRRRARAGAAVLTVLHDLTLALAADRLLVMQAGRLQADGPAADPAVRQALVRVFGQAFTLEAVGPPEARRWVAVPAL
jgi:iron complex transport system ATP-binding protein